MTQLATQFKDEMFELINGIKYYNLGVNNIISKNKFI